MSSETYNNKTFFHLNDLRDVVHLMATKKGWHEEERTVGDHIALMHTELSEALEEYRNGTAVDDIYFPMVVGPTGNKPEGIPIELADVIIRILDFCGLHNIDIETALQLKFEYNATRPLQRYSPLPSWRKEAMTLQELTDTLVNLIEMGYPLSSPVVGLIEDSPPHTLKEVQPEYHEDSGTFTIWIRQEET